MLATEVSTVDIQIPGTVGAMGLAVEGIGTVFFRRTTGDILGVRAEGTVGTTDSIRGDSLAAVNFGGQTRAVLAQGPSKVGGRHGGRCHQEDAQIIKTEFWKRPGARRWVVRQNWGGVLAVEGDLVAQASWLRFHLGDMKMEPGVIVCWTVIRATERIIRVPAGFPTRMLRYTTYRSTSTVQLHIFFSAEIRATQCLSEECWTFSEV